MTLRGLDAPHCQPNKCGWLCNLTPSWACRLPSSGTHRVSSATLTHFNQRFEITASNGSNNVCWGVKHHLKDAPGIVGDQVMLIQPTLSDACKVLLLCAAGYTLVIYGPVWRVWLPVCCSLVTWKPAALHAATSYSLAADHMHDSPSAAHAAMGVHSPAALHLPGK